MARMNLPKEGNAAVPQVHEEPQPAQGGSAPPSHASTRRLIHWVLVIEAAMVGLGLLSVLLRRMASPYIPSYIASSPMLIGVCATLLALICVTLHLHRRGNTAMLHVTAVGLTAIIPFIFSPQSFHEMVPQTFWLPVLFSLVISDIRTTTLVFVLSVGAAVASYPGAFQKLSVDLFTLATFGLLVTMRMIQDRLLNDALLARDQALASQAALRASHVLNEAMLNTTPDLIFMNRRDGLYIDAHANHSELLYVPTPQFIGRPITEVLPQSLAARYLQHFAQALDAKALQQMDYELDVDGSLHYFEARIMPSSADTVLTMVRDVTERRNSENQLAQYRDHLEELVQQRTEQLTSALQQVSLSDERYRLVQQATNDGIWDWNLLTHETYCSPAMLSLLGHDGDAPSLQSEQLWMDLIHPVERSGVLDTIAQSLATQGWFEIEFRLRSRRGEELWVLNRGKLVARAPDGRPSRAVGACSDLTARKTMELELRDAKVRADAASLAKSRFLANMSHEIRTPMNAIIGFTYLLRRSIQDSGQLAKLDKIEQSGKHLLRVINDILELSKIEADHVRLECLPLQLGAVLDHVRSIMHERVEHKQLALHIELAPELARRSLCGDALRLNQILLNLVSNAVKFTPSGWIRISARLEHEDAALVRVRFEVQDTGIGIAEADLPRLFEAFEQAEDSTTRQFGGTGLGLAISRKLARLMGGETGVFSQPGQGSTFWFTVAFQQCAEPSLAAPVRAQDTGGQKGTGQILLVEDNPINQEVAKEMLESRGFVVDLADHGGQALAMVQQKAYDLILMDVQMPVMDGFEATRQIRALEAYGKVPIVAMTANAFEEDRQRCLEAGMSGFLAKPVEPERLYAVIAQWI